MGKEQLTDSSKSINVWAANLGIKSKERRKMMVKEEKLDKLEKRIDQQE